MKKTLTANNSVTCLRSVMNFSAILLATLVGFTGCETGNFKSPPKSVAGDQPPPEKIILREGDALKISFPGSPNLDTEQQIRRDGKITLPLVGEVVAVGLTGEELHNNLVKLYEPQISSKQISVVLQASLFPIYMTGFVMRPGKITSSQPITALQAVMEVGVDYNKANLKAVRVLRRENGVAHNYVLNLKEILDGKDTEPFYLKPADVVYVPQKFSAF